MAHSKEQIIKNEIAKAFAKAEGEYISGQVLADLVGCSRVAIWKHIDQLRQDGYKIEAVKKKGYRLLNKLDSLTATDILMGLQTEFVGQSIYSYKTVTSTQTIARELADSGVADGTVVISNEQTEGTGRLKRKWHSPSNGGIWLSLILKPDIPPHHAPQLTLLTAVAVVQALKKIGVEAGIKWPNDVLIHGRKIAGILTELHAESDQIHHVIIGIGININQTYESFPDEIKEIATSVKIEKNQRIDQSEFLQDLFVSLEDLYMIFLEKGFEPIKQIWEKHSITIGRKVTVHNSQGTLTGIATGINQDGVLKVVDDDQKSHLVYSGDITVHQ